MVPKKVDWDEIRTLYEKARRCFWVTKGNDSWHRDEENGWYFLWSAYHFASISDEKEIDHRTYARILYMLANELRYKIFDYDRYHKYVLPAVKEFEKAKACGQKLGNKEFGIIKEECTSLEYKFKHEEYTEENWKETVSLIENGGLLDEYNFGFHDSKPVYFQHTDKEAILKLSYDGLLAVFRFEDLYNIEINTDPVTNWVNDFYCYKIMGTKSIIFTTGDYTIYCGRIILEKIVDEKGKT